MFKKIDKNRSVPAPNRLAMKSPQFYSELINRLVPAWGAVLKSKTITSPRIWCALWAGAVAVANACRISEVLRLLGSQVLPNGMAVVVGSKGSNARMIYTGLLASECEYLAASCAMRPVFCVVYKEVWDAVVRHGLAVQEPGHERRSVTHSGRYGVVQQLAPVIGERAAGEAIGHRSQKSVRYYAHPEECAHDRAVNKARKARETFNQQGPRWPDFLKEVFNA